MDRLLTKNTWTQVAKTIGNEKQKLAAIAYVSSDSNLRFKKGDILVCDASEQAIKSGETSAKTLKVFFEAGATLYSCPNLHAKILTCGNLTIIGSANLSTNAEYSLIEASLLTNRLQVRSQARVFIDRVISNSEPIDQKRLEYICSIPVIVRPPSTNVHKENPIEDTGDRVWIVSVHPISPERYQHEEKFVEKGEEEARSKASNPESDISWIRFTGKSKFRSFAKMGDTVIEIERNEKGNRYRVIQSLPILVRQDHEKWTRFYIEHPIEYQYFSWNVFEKELKKVNLQKIIKRSSCRELTPKQVTLMESIWE